MEVIKHRGRVIAVGADYTSVEMVVESACSACHAKALCAMSESENKVVEVPSSAYALVEVGEEVNVCLKSTMGHKAVWLAYVAPLAVMIASLFVILSLGGSELAAGLGSMGMVALYYFIIWLLREKLRSEYVFKIEKL